MRRSAATSVKKMGPPPEFIAVSNVHSNSGSFTNSNQGGPNIPNAASGTSVGDHMFLVCVHLRYGNTVGTVANPPGWTLLAEYSQNGSTISRRIYVFHRIVQSGDHGVQTSYVLNGNNYFLVSYIMVYRNLASNPLRSYAGSALPNPSNVLLLPSVYAQAGDLLLGVGGSVGTGGVPGPFTTASVLTERIDASAISTSFWAYGADRQIDTSGNTGNISNTATGFATGNNFYITSMALTLKRA